ncbi:tRNA (guanosine(37)-N1)-methyltransferase TrmD [Herbivorax sp. ANBcel31]|uniref:tRNA (guanosine(37)-N1)-methyltransferase TrmD n=1 Tax=Herbivorax sp. ANBcel31 TaxID=3069754 RepID=UPI0027B40BA6|nr:tRNA (guanosine(37)-N1)-methyltransferase TrmD [Herbivorax sp. ANBcel31]MDQ2087020.1 tRNA (guanosine(37)-N1)-methyltransferase TrmD [Herbivorax sp. ANBcel31]
MKFDILTLFPDIFDCVMKESIIGKAQQKNVLEINAINIRDFSKNKHKKADDYPYGGGGGMVMMAQPIYDAYLSIIKNLKYKPKLIYLSPQGKVLNQKKVMDLSKENHLILLCGHYEGIDERIIEEIVDEEISIGDYVLTGGEIPAMTLIDSVSRLVPGVLPHETAYQNESHYDGLLEHPQYTRPYEFKGRKVPDILLSGHHKNIEEWRKKESLKRTLEKRPDLIQKNREDSKKI